eukprot:CAMPEP_0118652598 /NCGR_PEP_ID=MMETSP0785-20121206/11400_1 /TAXON_ID=91992 /ORGANISM="Bolidomonas pacifica, Strain CCMP 1866" /LENGTH=249 /DNA_ID=CAMNT_0006545119 /DNA_START=276 /DNA_END=1022 /DNA_ORIENTATION=-
MSTTTNTQHTEPMTEDPSAPVIEKGIATFCTSTLNPHLTCTLCNGLFRNATTITECLHTFCRACLFKHFRASKPNCPICGIHLNLTLETTILPDRIMQDLVKKIFPEVLKEEEKQEEEFYKERGIKRKPTQEPPKVVKPKKKVSTPQPFENTDELNFQLVPIEGTDLPNPSLGLPKLSKPFLRTSGRLKILQVKKYIQKKLDISVESSSLSIFCKGGILGDELNLTFIQRTRWLNNPNDLVLHFRLKAQ